MYTVYEYIFALYNGALTIVSLDLSARTYNIRRARASYVLLWIYIYVYYTALRHSYGNPHNFGTYLRHSYGNPHIIKVSTSVFSRLFHIYIAYYVKPALTIAYIRQPIIVITVFIHITRLILFIPIRSHNKRSLLLDKKNLFAFEKRKKNARSRGIHIHTFRICTQERGGRGVKFVPYPGSYI